MPILDDEQVQELLELAKVHGVCRECGHRTANDYCRSCDEFYWLHAPGCTMYEPKHFGHRLTIVPFVEDRGGGQEAKVSRHDDPQVIFFSNGVTAVLRDGQQQPILQQSWAELFAEWLESQSEDPTGFRLQMPNGQSARFFRTSSGWSWRFE